jgi:hypothetical protein
MANDTLLNTPVIWINKYLQDKLSDLGLSSVPFFPTVPSTIEDLNRTFPGNNNGLMAVYDRLIRMNRSGFPHIKCEQLLYYFYATEQNNVKNMVQITEAVFRLLDRGDESAQEINNWCSNRRINLGTTNSPDYIDNIFFFHNFKVYQLEEVRDIIDFGTARTYGGNKMIIEFDYHHNPIDLTGAGNEDTATYSDWKPEKMATKEII